MPHGLQKSVPASIAQSLFKLTFFVVVLLLRLVSVAECPANIVRFDSPHRSMIVVKVRVNGEGPYSFLFDTGATSSAVDPELSASLHLSVAKSVKLDSWETTVDARRVLLESLSFGPIHAGPLTVLVQPLTEFKAFDSHLRGVLGQDVLLRSNYLIDNRHHRIEFDYDDALLAELTGDRISVAPVRTRTGDLESRLIAIPVQMDRNTGPLHLLLDSGADMVVLQPHFVSPVTLPRGTKWMADENGKISSASTFHKIGRAHV